MICFVATIYALRKSRYLTREQLAEQLSVSRIFGGTTSCIRAGKAVLGWVDL